MAGSGVQAFGRPQNPKGTGALVLAASNAADPLAAGVAHAVPEWAHSFTVFVSGAGPVWMRVQSGTDITTDAPSFTTMHTYPGGTLLGPFPIERSGSTDALNVIVATATGGTVTGYRINWYR